MDSLKNHIHINLDVGEGIVDETQLFSKVSIYTHGRNG